MRLKGYFEHTSTGVRTLLFVVVSSVSFLFFVFLAGVITHNDYTQVGSLKIAQFLNSCGLFVLPPFIVAYLWSARPARKLEMDHVPQNRDLLLAFGLTLVSAPLINYLMELNAGIRLPESLSGLEGQLKAIEEQADLSTRRMLEADHVGALLVNIGLIALIPAVGEEFFFRGIVLKLFREKRGIHLSVWATAFIFSLVHFQFYGFIPRMVMGALLGYLFVWTKNIWVPVFAHFVNNAMVVISFYFIHDELSISMGEAGTMKNMVFALVSLALTSVLLYLLRLRFYKTVE